jgi:hypothetical protein
MIIGTPGVLAGMITAAGCELLTPLLVFGVDGLGYSGAGRDGI